MEREGGEGGREGLTKLAIFLLTSGNTLYRLPINRTAHITTFDISAMGHWMQWCVWGGGGGVQSERRSPEVTKVVGHFPQKTHNFHS